MRINFIGELPGTPPDRTLLVTKDADYCAASAELRRDLAAAYDTIWIRQEHHFTWLQVFADHCGIGLSRLVEFAKTTARDQLAARWRLSVPEWLTDDLILAEQLLDRDLPPGTHESAAAVLLSSLITPISLISPAFPRAQAGLLAEKASAPKFQAGLTASAVTRAAWQNTLNSWTAAAASAWSPDFCERLRADPGTLWRDLTVWRLLQRYPAAQQEFALDPAAVTFVRSVPVEALKDMVLHPDGRALALDQIQPLFEQLQAAVVSRTKFDALLNAVSGELHEEFAGLDAILNKASFKIERGDVESIVRRFQSCAELGPAAFAKLHLYVPPPEPAAIDAATADAATWTRWFHEEYLSYRWWQMARKETNPAVEKTVGDFSE